MKTNKFLACLGLSVACFMVASSAYAAVAGYVQFVSGDVQITSPAGQTHPAQKGDAVGEGDTVISASAASAQIKMQDGGFVAMRPDTKLKFDQFVFSGKQDGNEKSFFSLLKGGFRAVTGLIGQVNKQNYRITTPSATIGIRGTDHETFLVVPGSSMAQIAPTGAYSKVNVGETSLTTNKGTINVLPNQMGFAGGMDQAPKLQPVNTNVFTVAEASTPEAKAEKKEEKKEEKAEAKQEQKTTKSDKEEKKEGGKDSKQADKGNGEARSDTKETKQEGAAAESKQAKIEPATPQETVPIRSTAVVDTKPSVPGGLPAPTTPVVTTTATVAEVIAPPPAPTTIVNTAPVAGGTTVNIITGTATTNTGQVIPVIQGLFATQAQAAADAALLAANAAATAVTAMQTASTQVTALLPVDTAPASTAIATASPLVAGAATTYATASAITPVATAPASTAVTTASTNVNAATTAVATANALAPVATTSATTAIGTANTNIGTANPAVTTATALTPVNAATATANAAAAQTAATAATAQATTAQAALTANGVFADTTAAPALTAAQAANATLQPANTAVQGAVTTISTNNTSLTNAQTAAQTALTAATNNLATANSNLTTATTQNAALTAAQTAAPIALATAQANLVTANNNLATAITQSVALTAAQTAAQSALTAAQTNLTAANTGLTTVTAQNATIAAAQASIPTQLTAAQTAAAAAQAAAAAAQAAAAQAATLQAAGDLAGAQAQMTIAQNGLTIAQQQQAAATAAQTAATTALTGAQTAQTTGLVNVNNAVTAATAAQTAANTVTTQAALAAPAAAAASTALAAVTPAANTATTDAGTASTQAAAAQTAASTATTAVTTATTAANTAATDATTAQTQAAAAQTASTNANAALTTFTTNLAAVNTNAPIVATNAPVAAYNNPAVAGGSFVGVTMLSTPVTGGYNTGFIPNQPLQANTTYVLDGTGNLVEMRIAQFQQQTNPNGTLLTPTITTTVGADIKWSGGTAADTFKLTDNSIYIGRWVTPTVTVKDNTTPLNAFTYTPKDSVWAVVRPPATGYVQSLVGSVTYTKAGNTTPVDAAGITGTLNSATLTANFTSQLVNAAVNLTMGATSAMAGTYNLSATGVPIQAATSINPSGFGVANASGLTTTCTGACAAGVSGYSGDLGGGFAGTGAASAGMSYDIWPTVAVGSPMTSSVHGLVAFNTATAPSVAVSPPAGSYNAGFIVPVAITGGYTTARPIHSPPMPNTSIVLAGTGGNLVKLSGISFEEPGATTPLLSNANVTWSGGTATDYYHSTSGNITFGRWQGGSVNVTDLATTAPVAPFSISLAQTGGMVGPTSSVWGYAVATPTNYVQSLVGTTSYTKTGNTTPFDSLGGMGVLNSASLSANFTNQMVNAALQLTMNTGTYTSDVFNVSATMPVNLITAFDPSGFKTVNPGGSATVTCGTGPCTGGAFRADVRGTFAGATANDAVLGYAVYATPTTTPPANIISGLVAFNTATPPTVNPAGPLAAYVATGTAVAYNGGGNSGGYNFIAAPGEVTPLGNPTTFTENYGGGWGFRKDVLNGATTATPPTTTTNGITFGVWENVASVSASEQHLIAPSNGGNSSHSYMYGAEGYLDSPVAAGTNTGPLIGAFTYTQAAMTSYDKNTWATGTATSATLSANFTSQTVSVALAGTMGATSWTSTSTNTPITFMNTTTGTGASFNNSAPAITVNTVACPTCGGNINGSFVGQNFAGAIVQYNVWDNNNLNVDGSVAFDRMPVVANPAVTNGTPVTYGTFVLANNSSNVERPTAITTGAGGVLTGWSVGSSNSTVTPAVGSVAQTAVGTGSGTINWGQWVMALG